MSKLRLLLRTFGWAAVGFLVTSGAVVALGASFESGNYNEGLTQGALALIAAAIAGVIAALGALRFSDSPAGRALNQFVQMVAAGLAVLGVADLTGAAGVAFLGATLKLVVASGIGALQAYLVNLPAPPASAEG